MGFLLLQLGYNLTYELHPVVTLQIRRFSQPNMVCNHQSVGFPQLELHFSSKTGGCPFDGCYLIGICLLPEGNHPCQLLNWSLIYFRWYYHASWSDFHLFSLASRLLVITSASNADPYLERWWQWWLTTFSTSTPKHTQWTKWMVTDGTHFEVLLLCSKHVLRNTCFSRKEDYENNHHRTFAHDLRK